MISRARCQLDLMISRHRCPLDFMISRARCPLDLMISGLLGMFTFRDSEFLYETSFDDMGCGKSISSQAAVPTSVAQKRGLCFVGTLSATLAIVQVKGLALDFPMTGVLHGSIWPPRPVGICGGHKRCMSMLK